MSDLEGLARRMSGLGRPRGAILARLVGEILDYKNISENAARVLADAVLGEVEASSIPLEDPDSPELGTTASGVTMGDQGVGCRGTGDFLVHRLIAEISDAGVPMVLSPRDMDDAGAIEAGQGNYIVVKMEGMHSRLSDFPFLAGFHVTRAALRDLYVKGAFPGGVAVDLHLGDDSDVGKLFDFTAGVATVCKLSGCPILGGSTLRIGGDMVIGTRMTGGVAAVGTAYRLLPRRSVRPGDAIIMTEGAGGGTICTAAIYSGHHGVVKETLNLKFISACRALLDGESMERIHCMADVTNGGIRADLHEIGEEASCGAEVDEGTISSLVNERVKDLLDEEGIDYLGVSLDSLLIFCENAVKERVISQLQGVGVKSAVIGRTTPEREVRVSTPDGVSELLPRFRESAYTEVKKVVDSRVGGTPPDMENRVRKAAETAILRREKVIEYIRSL